MLSPNKVGSVDTRKSMVFLLPTAIFILPSWGTRRSAILRPAKILSLEFTAFLMLVGRFMDLNKYPSRRYLTWSIFSKGSMWMSLTPSLMALTRMPFTNLIIGASDAVYSSTRALSSSSPTNSISTTASETREPKSSTTETGCSSSVISSFLPKNLLYSSSLIS